MSPAQELLGKKALRLIEYGGLFIITIATLVAGGQEVYRMILDAKVTLADLLLLFLYLEVIAMVAVYLDSGKLPVRMPLYIAIVALARYLALDIKALDPWSIIAVAAAITVLAGAVLMIRYGQLRFPYPPYLPYPPGKRKPKGEREPE
ncbi:MAG: phosphate-starvation-inducible PsiE family protein [Gammaproteobacteria bacterium]|nr:phosphate-starvation-inducible PsiE family protein [Gammaproteobacteria bacterium]